MPRQAAPAPIANPGRSVAPSMSPPTDTDPNRRSPFQLGRRNSHVDLPPDHPPMPSRSAWQRNALPAVQAVLTPACVITSLVLSAVLSLAFGAAIVIASDGLVVVEVRYDHVNQYRYPMTAAAQNASRVGGGRTYWVNGTAFPQGTRTTVSFDIPRVMQPPVFLSYKMTKFYQNYRQYGDSQSHTQLLGDEAKKPDLVDCDPLRSPGELIKDDAARAQLERRAIAAATNVTLLYGDMVYWPCGVVAWTMFNDSFTLWHTPPTPPPVGGVTSAPVAPTLICNASDFDAAGRRLVHSETANPCSKSGIAWPADRNRRHRDLKYHGAEQWTGFGRQNTSDEFLHRGWYYNEAGHRVPIMTDEDVIVWMRLAPLPTFRKIHRVLHSELAPGRYRLDVDEFFDTASYGGEKYAVLATYSWLGGRNYFMGVALVIGGALALVFAVALFLRHYQRSVLAKETDGSVPDPDAAHPQGD